MNNNSIYKFLKEDSERLQSLKPIKFATDDKLDEIILKIQDSINKQNELINAINNNSSQANRYAQISIAISVLALITSLVVSLCK